MSRFLTVLSDKLSILMLTDTLKIYVDRLRDGEKDKIDATVAPDFMDVQDDGIKFIEPIHVKGEFYLAEHEFVMHLDVSTKGQLPCRVCNRDVTVEISIKDAYQVVKVSDIKGAVFDLSDTLREMILLEVPSYAECNQGACKERKDIASYMKSEKKEQTEGQNPFANLSSEDLNI